MYKINHNLFVLFAMFQTSICQRRIKDGKEVVANKTYMVYLLSDSSAPVQYHGWLCGGAIISKDYVITSAACIQDVQHMYVISGYRKYVPSDKIDEDECVRQKKKKVVLTCVPRTYQFEYNKTEVWSKVDIGVVKVESSFDFTDASYEQICSYIPQPIDFNVEKDFPKVGDDVIVLGWGHDKMYRKDTDLIDLNKETLHYAPTKILHEEICINYFQGNPELAAFIASSMLCTLEPGNLNEKGELILRSPPNAKGCISEKDKLDGMLGKMCEEDLSEFYGAETVGEITYELESNDEIVTINDTRRLIPETQTQDETDKIEEIVNEETSTVPENLPEGEDTPGICQNDHGGPLVAWRGGQEVIVGIASLFKLDRKQQCRGPYLYTKTWCNGAFLHCIIDQVKKNETRRSCDHPSEVGFEIVRRHISWIGHRDGPADNERIQARHQVPMSAFHP